MKKLILLCTITCLQAHFDEKPLVGIGENGVPLKSRVIACGQWTRHDATSEAVHKWYLLEKEGNYTLVSKYSGPKEYPEGFLFSMDVSIKETENGIEEITQKTGEYDDCQLVFNLKLQEVEEKYPTKYKSGLPRLVGTLEQSDECCILEAMMYALKKVEKQQEIMQKRSKAK